jgi:hypothetical protein
MKISHFAFVKWFSLTWALLPACYSVKSARTSNLQLFTFTKRIYPSRLNRRCSFTHSTFYRILNLWKTTGDVVKHRFGLPGWPWILHFDDVDHLLCLIRHNPDYFLDELLYLLQTNCFISTWYTTNLNMQECPPTSSLPVSVSEISKLDYKPDFPDLIISLEFLTIY